MDLVKEKENSLVSNCSKYDMMNITSVRFLMCIFIIIGIIIIKNNNVYWYSYIKEMYLSQNAIEIIDAESIKSYSSLFFSSIVPSAFDFLKIWTVNIFRSVTS